MELNLLYMLCIIIKSTLCSNVYNDFDDYDDYGYKKGERGYNVTAHNLSIFNPHHF